MVSEAQYWETEPVWMDEPAAHMEGVSDSLMTAQVSHSTQ